MFILKKIVSQFLYPLPLSVLFLITGLVFLLFTPKQTLGKSCCVLSLLILLGFSYSWIASPLTARLEYSFTPLLAGQSINTTTDLSTIRWIVVLANVFSATPNLPPTSQLGRISLARTIESIRLHRKLPHSTILFSGGGFHQDTGTTSGVIMAMTAQELGIEPAHIKVNLTASDTREEATHVKTALGQEPFILVTSASHMPRAMAIFQKLGMHPIASPSDYDVHLAKRSTLSISDFFPSAHQLIRSQKAIHEYVGMLWAKIRGYI